METRSIMLVCHSAGGILGSRVVSGLERSAMVGQRSEGGVVNVAFVAAFLLRDGQSAFEMIAGRPEWIDLDDVSLAFGPCPVGFRSKNAARA